MSDQLCSGVVKVLREVFSFELEVEGYIMHKLMLTEKR